MRKIIAFLLLLATLSPVCAQQVITGVPPVIVGYGTLSVANSSILASTMTAGPSSATWPPTNNAGVVFVLNDSASAGNLYVCPLGGACTTSNGLELIPGRSWGFYKPSTAMTVIATSTATAQFQW